LFGWHAAEGGLFDITVGEKGTRTQIYNAWNSDVPSEFKSLATDKRILAPCKQSFDTGQTNANYFQSYIDELWNTWTSNGLRFTNSNGQEYRGTMTGGVLTMRIGDATSGPQAVVHKPNTQEVLEGKGTLDWGDPEEGYPDKNPDLSLAVQAQICAAINRGVAHLADWGTTPAARAQYYNTDKPLNHYSGFWHRWSINGHTYAFCYDDVFDQSTTMVAERPTALVIDLKW
jgi:hypothetical protein